MMSLSTANWQEVEGGHNGLVFCLLKVAKASGVSIDNSIIAFVTNYSTLDFIFNLVLNTFTHYRTNHNFIKKDAN